MISEDQQDQAALFALGLLDDEERAEFERALAADPELRALAGELRETAASLALAAGPGTLPPPAALKARLLAGLAGGSPGAEPARQAPRRFWTPLPWALAAAAVLTALLTVLNGIRQQEELRRELKRARAAESSLRTETRQQGLTIQQLDEARERDALARQQINPLMQVAVYQLEPTPAGPAQPRVTVVWDAARRAGELYVSQLRPPGSGHDYQLWVVEEGNKEPVSAGLVRVDPEGRATVDFKPADPGKAKASAFALSLEPAGGSEKNQGPILLLGKP